MIKFDTKFGIISILMGTHCASLDANLFLFYHEREFMTA